MKILVTGATGFIGKHFLESVHEGPHDVVSLVRATSDTTAIRRLKIRLTAGNITEPDSLDAVFRAERPDYVVHAAARVKDESEKEIYGTNIEGTRNICEASLKHGVKRLIYLSSVSVVSGNPEVPLTEGLPYKATSAYGWSKAEAEKVAIGYRKRGLRTAILRPCMVYGEGEPHALDRMFNLIRKKLIPLPGIKGISEKLHLVHVDNVVYAMKLCLERDAALEGTFFIADKEVITISKFVEIVSDEMGGGKPFLIPAWVVRLGLLLPPVRRRFDRVFKDRVYDITRARALLGYEPPVATEEGLRRTVRSWLGEK